MVSPDPISATNRLATAPVITERDAEISTCGLYRYSLTRIWGDGQRVCWVMLNPSTADAEQDDPTIRRCISFSQRLRAGMIEVVNLYAYRSPNPRDLVDSLHAGINIVGPDNDMYIRQAVGLADRTIVAWGASAPKGLRGIRVGQRVELVSQAVCGVAFCLGFTSNGQPRHPLYVKGDTPLRAWRP